MVLCGSMWFYVVLCGSSIPLALVHLVRWLSNSSKNELSLRVACVNGHAMAQRQRPSRQSRRIPVTAFESAEVTDNEMRQVESLDKSSSV